jgi:branched-chain amino acid transport system substrate-binding protein
MKLKQFLAIGTVVAVSVAITGMPASSATKKKASKATTTTKAAPTTVAPAPTAAPASTAPATTAKPATSSLVSDKGPCKASVPAYKVGIIAPFETPVLSLIDQVQAMEASVKAFNARGGISGHCMELTTCDDKFNPNQEVECARQLVDKGVVATLNDTTSVNPQGAIDVFLPAGVARFGISPGSQDLAASSIPITNAMGLGGTGTTLMMAAACLQNGYKKIGMINVDSPQIAGLIGLMGTMLKAYGATLVGNVPVPGGTTDFQQFPLAMEKAGATCTILPLGENEAKQVLRAAQQLGGTMKYSASLGTFGLADLQKFGNFASQMFLNSEFPPATASTTKYPILKVALADLAASGKPALQRDELKSSPLRSWITVWAFVRIIEQFGTPEDI